jgi:Ser/Thr protein kinase RdoA (MazF antagonist)
MASVSEVTFPPSSVLDRANVSPHEVAPVVGHAGVWLLTSSHGSVVLRRYALQPPLHGIPAVTVVADRTGGDMNHRLGQLRDTVAWLHAFLGRVASRFPTPNPVGLFDGQSWCATGDEVWEALTFLPGSVIGWRPSPSLREVGAFVARYHMVVSELNVAPRPVVTPLGSLHTLADWTQARRTMCSDSRARTLGTLLDDFHRDLGEIGYDGATPGVIHGDATTHNIVASGDPLKPSGLIDFQLAYHEPLAADIAFGLWRSGRPAQNAETIDTSRVSAFIAGYHEVRPLTDADLAALPVYLRGRGLQMLVKRTKLGIANSEPLPLVLWSSDHRAELERAAFMGARRAG